MFCILINYCSMSYQNSCQLTEKISKNSKAGPTLEQILLNFELRQAIECQNSSALSTSAFGKFSLIFKPRGRLLAPVIFIVQILQPKISNILSFLHFSYKANG